MKFLYFSLALLSVPGLLVLGHPHDDAGSNARRHLGLSNRVLSNAGLNANSTLEKRIFADRRATWYAVGLDACGQVDHPNDHIVAISHIDFDRGANVWPKPICWSNIVIRYNGKQANAKIVDRCAICPEGGLDLSKGLFSFFQDPGLGVISVDWWYANDPPHTSTTTRHSTTAVPTSTGTTSGAGPSTTAGSTTTISAANNFPQLVQALFQLVNLADATVSANLPPSS